MSVPQGRIEVLHVDDDSGFRGLVAEYLEQESDAIAVETAGSAAAGIEYLREQGADCVVSDYEMPETDGLEFLEAVRADHPELPFVLFTGKGSEEIASEAISAGVTDYLQKRGPEQLSVLARRVENAVAQYRAERRLERTQDKLESLHGKASELMEATTEAEIFDLAVEAAEEVLELETCGIYELTGGEFVPRAVRNLDHDQNYLSEGEGVAGEAYRRGESVLVDDVQSYGGAEPIRDRFRSTLTVPLGDVGVFQATTEAVEAYSERDRELTELLMNHVTEALNSVRYERDLRAVDERLEAILENTTAIIYVKDLEGRYELVNSRYASVLGMDREEILGRTDFDIQSEKYAREVRENDRRAIETESPVEVEEEAFRDGEVRTYISVKVPMFDEDGDPVAVCGISTDITERKRREEQFRTLHAVAGTLDDCDSPSDVYDALVEGARDVLEHDLAVVDVVEDGDVVEAVATNDGEPAAGRTTAGTDLATEAYEREESLVADHLGSGDRGPYDSVLAVPIDGHGTFRILAEDGTAFDQSDVELVETLVSHAVTTLDRLDRTESLRERTAELERQNERLDQFARIVSHDLRNPLGVAEGHLELARRECDSDHLAEIGQAHDRMRTLVEDLLALARDGEVVADPEPVSLERAVSECWDTVETGEATLRTTADRQLEADRQRFRQLIENLVRNAVEHGSTDGRPETGDADDHETPSGRATTETGRSEGRQADDPGAVTVTVGGLPDGFYVEDDGPGIPPENREAALEAGHTTGNGTGLGLSIVQRVAEAHGWDVSVTDGTDGGARFEVTGVDSAD
jgi:PAS domain S-box-containing protein